MNETTKPQDVMSYNELREEYFSVKEWQQLALFFIRMEFSSLDFERHFGSLTPLKEKTHKILYKLLRDAEGAK